MSQGINGLSTIELIVQDLPSIWYFMEIANGAKYIVHSLLLTRFILGIRKWSLANSTDQDRTPQNAAFDQGIHCLRRHSQFTISWATRGFNKSIRSKVFCSYSSFNPFTRDFMKKTPSLSLDMSVIENRVANYKSNTNLQTVKILMRRIVTISSGSTLFPKVLTLVCIDERVQHNSQ